MPLVYLAVVAALAAIQQPGQKPTKPRIVDVRIVVASRASLEEQCKAGTFAAYDILVDANPRVNEPYHCPGRRLLEHKNAHADKRTLVQISYMNQDSVRWYSDTEFSITRIGLHDDPPSRDAPTNPFAPSFAIPSKPSKSINSGRITTKAAVNHQYKIYLAIRGRSIDPDVWCNE
jgi:hypothetical protein